MARQTLNDDQKNAFHIIKKFLAHPVVDTFLLLGYAGTGKTYLLQQIAKWMEEKNLPFSLLASTGRASVVLRGKTGLLTRTVHSELYHFSKIEGDDEELTEDSPIHEYGQMTLQFQLREPDEESRIYIVDESSMLSSIPSDGGGVSFGSGSLLIDFFQAVGKNKLIFVGDPCQLPPVGQQFSPALDIDWLTSRRRTAISFLLTRIERTVADNDILVLANGIRNLSLQTSWPKYPKIPARNLFSVKLYKSQKDLFDSYLERYKQVGVNGTLAIARSNKTVYQINKAIRRDLFGQLDKPLQVGDIILVMQNNHSVPLTNGDFVIVKDIGELRLQATLHFMNVRVKSVASDSEYELLLSLDILYGTLGRYTNEQQKTLMVDFSRRMKRKKIKPNTDAYNEQLLKDAFVNCLKATFGYAVTCHKAQGGEWDHIYLFLDASMYGIKPPELCKWWYTAVTRAKLELHLEDAWWIC